LRECDRAEFARWIRTGPEELGRSGPGAAPNRWV